MLRSFLHHLWMHFYENRVWSITVLHLVDLLYQTTFPIDWIQENMKNTFWLVSITLEYCDTSNEIGWWIHDYDAVNMICAMHTVKRRYATTISMNGLFFSHRVFKEDRIIRLWLTRLGCTYVNFVIVVNLGDDVLSCELFVVLVISLLFWKENSHQYNWRWCNQKMYFPAEWLLSGHL